MPEAERFSFFKVISPYSSMCFSATASFSAGVVLTVIGIASIRKAKKPAQLVFASIPLIFAVQQISEGFLWLALSDPYYAPLRGLTTYVFLFFAQIVWPLCVPFSILLLEQNQKKRKLLKFFSGIAVITSMVLAAFLIIYDVTANIDGHHIAYDQEYPAKLLHYGAIPYLIVTIVPLFFSSVKRMWFLGTTVLVSYVITAIFYQGYILSVWCFFASIISIIVFVIMRELFINE